MVTHARTFGLLGLLFALCASPSLYAQEWPPQPAEPATPPATTAPVYVRLRDGTELIAQRATLRLGQQIEVLGQDGTVRVLSWTEIELVGDSPTPTPTRPPEARTERAGREGLALVSFILGGFFGLGAIGALTLGFSSIGHAMDPTFPGAVTGVGLGLGGVSSLFLFLGFRSVLKPPRSTAFGGGIRLNALAVVPMERGAGVSAGFVF